MKASVCLAVLTLLSGIALAQTQTGTAPAGSTGTQTPATTSTTATAEMQTQTYKGILVDASCASGSSTSTAPATASNTQENTGSAGTASEKPKKKASRKAAAGTEGPTCSPSAGTSQFALKLNDGRVIKFDSVGNQRAQEALKANKKWTENAGAGKPIHVKASGVLNGDKLTVVSLG
jgi:hypothetical protein